jgi:hypothetical protein
MALTELIFKITPAEIGLVALDASVEEVHSASATVTRHPVEAEQGTQTDVSDNVQIDPVTIQIQGVVTNHPAEWLGTFDNSETRDVQAYLELLTTLLTGTLITVTTTLLEYDDMVLERLQVTRNKEKGNALYLDATATQVRLVTLEESAVEAGQRPVSQSTRNGGAKSAKPADAATSTKSSLGFKALF